jgi:Restriction Enzyme Adenine Methylase Associated
VPIFELDEGNLVPFRRQAIDSGVYEAEIEALLWDNLEEITGDNLFRVARQATLPSGGRPDIVALDPSGRVVVIEVKRDVDRNQLAQSLEYAGWARNTSLDELAGLFHAGERDFWAEWQEFTGTPTPVVVQKDPRLYLVARTFHQRTFEALEFLLQHRLPVQVLKVAFYVDENGRRFLNVEWTEEPEAAPVHMPATADSADDAPIEVVDTEARDYREVTLAEVADVIGAPTSLVWIRPRKGERFEATLLANGVIRLASGVEHRSPSGAAMAVADVVSYDGWYAWRVGEGGPTLNDFRRRVARSASSASGSDGQRRC